ncbi:MAG: tRNA (adenosine(37)-N6)-dimethylallyltransferase MiaA [Chlorobi bacterium]|nr:tRNA (adenosine(37)-N6)-dimethylallyltransferase MiaA [Chlorobiota bacterium]
MPRRLVTILGPTAVGKTIFAVKLADAFDGEIISADSRQVYKRMDIGTGKDVSDYSINGKTISSHLIDLIEPADEYNLFSFVKDFNQTFEDISKRNKLPFLVGGTGMYLNAVLNKYELKKADFHPKRKEELEKLSDKELRKIFLSYEPNPHDTTDVLYRKRMIASVLIHESPEHANLTIAENFNSLVIGVMEDRSEIKKRITARLKKRLKEGMIEEVKRLLDEGVPAERLKRFGLEYRFVTEHLSGELNYNDMYQKLNSAIHKFAKRQMTWFRKMEREGIEINWMKNDEIRKAEKLIDVFLNKKDE